LEHLAVDEVIVKNSWAGLSSGSTFQRKANVLASKFTLCDESGYIYMT
jgi:hypothetical protein